MKIRHVDFFCVDVCQLFGLSSQNSTSMKDLFLIFLNFLIFYLFIYLFIFIYLFLFFLGGVTNFKPFKKKHLSQFKTNFCLLSTENT